jgi:predicted CoA-binding protein
MSTDISDEQIIGILQDTNTIAVVGASPKPDRHSHRVMHYLQLNGYRTIPVNPAAAGETILGEKVYAGLADIPEAFELVDVFRRPEAVDAVVDEVLEAKAAKGIRFLWLQPGANNGDAAERAREQGLEVVAERCMKIEFGRLLSHG